MRAGSWHVHRSAQQVAELLFQMASEGGELQDYEAIAEADRLGLSGLLRDSQGRLFETRVDLLSCGLVQVERPGLRALAALTPDGEHSCWVCLTPTGDTPAS